MLRKRPPIGSAFERHPSEPPRTRRPLERRDRLAIGGALVAGAVFGLALHFADSLPPDLSFIGVAAKVVAGLSLLLGGAASLMESAGGQPRNLLMCGALIAGTIVAYPLGPGITPGIAVPGTFTITYEAPAGEPQVLAALHCDWAPGRGRIARITSDVFRFSGRDLTLRVDFYGDRVSFDSGDTTAYVRFGPEALLPAGPGDPPLPADDRVGSVHLDLLPNIAVDPTGPEEVIGTLTWECRPPEPV